MSICDAESFGQVGLAPEYQLMDINADAAQHDKKDPLIP